MDLLQLLFSFKGRIRRLYWWVATIAVTAAAGAITGVLEVAAKETGSFMLDPDTQQIEPTGPFAVAVFVTAAANLWINFALSVKRLHDRDRTGWWLVAQTLSLIVAVIAMVVAIVMFQEKASAELVAGYIVTGMFCVVALIISLWLFVEIGFLRGTQGPNRFGSDPLGATQADAAL